MSLPVFLLTLFGLNFAQSQRHDYNQRSIYMQNKLQELTDKLYNEGLSKGRQEGEAILNEARSQAEEIISKARAEAARITADAEKEASELKAKVESDLKMAAGQCIAATKNDIGNLLVNKVSDKDITTALTSAEFVKQVIMAVAQAFNAGASEPVALSVILPESLKKDVEPFLKKELASVLGAGVEAGFSRKVSGGFTIGPKGEGWFVSFTDETFRELISGYLRPVTKKILFGE